MATRPSRRGDDGAARAVRALAALEEGCPPPAEGASTSSGLHRRALVARVMTRIAEIIAEARDLPTAGIAAMVARGAEVNPDGGLDRATRAALSERLDEALSPPLPLASADALGAAYEAILEGRRRGGCHYTSPPLADRIALLALSPLLGSPHPDAARGGGCDGATRILDPAMGSGACLLAAFRLLDRTASDAAPLPAEAARLRRRALAARLHGVDVDPLATVVARLASWIELADPDVPPSFAEDRLVTADALGPAWPPGGQAPFDAVVGNPPWVSYVGRAAQPLEPARRAHFVEHYRAFAGYRNLQGLFVERAASLLRPGGRLALLVPSSMSEQLGYAPTRRALDRLAEIDPSLPDIGEEAFPGVFQPCMIVAATRRRDPEPSPRDEAWPVERPDLDEAGQALLARLAGRPTLPADLFGERGVQTSGGEAADLAPRPDERHTLALRGGGDIVAFERRPARAFADPSRLGRRFRDTHWGAVAVLLRQTAAFPIAAASDGGAFRNSLLAGFEGHGYSRWFLLAWLNASPVRWHHQMRFRDARQGMPQVKVGHLRAIPAPTPGLARAALEALGERLGRENQGLREEDQDAIDAAAAALLELGESEVGIVTAWRARLRSGRGGDPCSGPR